MCPPKCNEMLQGTDLYAIDDHFGVITRTSPIFGLFILVTWTSRFGLFLPKIDKQWTYIVY